MSKIEDAIVDFIKTNGTFYASLLSQMHRRIDTKQPTMGVKMKNGRISLLYNPEFLEGRSMKDTKAVLEHECLHIVMEHFIRSKNKEHKEWKVACDLAINQLLRYVPPDAISLDSIFGQDRYKYQIQNEQNAEYYYPLLQKSKEAQKNMGGDGKCGCGTDLNDADSQAEGTDQELSREMIKQMVNEAVKASKGQGQLPAGLEKYIDELFQPPKVSWRTILRRFVANSIKSGSKASWKKPSRRYGSSQKGRVADRTIALTLVIDTSGSIDDGMLQQFMTEVCAIQQSYRSVITVIECDAKVQREYKLKKFEKLKRDVQGRGGTSFKPPFIYIKEKNIRTDAVIYFTDLCGDFPEKKPNVPILWAYYNTGWGSSNVHVPFGTIVKLEKETSNEDQ